MINSQIDILYGNFFVMIVKENINFERGIDPKSSMDIGLIAKIRKITSGDLELLKLYTDGYGKGHTNDHLIEEMYGDSPEEYEFYSKRVREVYKLLEPYEYLFGDVFETSDKKEIREFVKSYLKNPNYNFVYDCGMGDEEVDVFFCEIELPSANEITPRGDIKVKS